MTGKFIDTLYYLNAKTKTAFSEGFFFVETQYGKLRVFDTGGSNKPTIINVPDGPNMIEHQLNLVSKLSKRYRVICFEYPGLGFSYPNETYDYSFESGSYLLLHLMEILKVKVASLLFSCSNGFYAMNAAKIDPTRIQHIFISQTPSVSSMVTWTQKSIPNFVKIPVLGQVSNLLMKQKLAHIWFQYALPKESTHRTPFRGLAREVLTKGGCFCLSSLVQNLKREAGNQFQLGETDVTLVWGAKDFTHRKTDKESIREHVQSCEIVEFEQCGHFPELEDTDRYVRLINERLG